MRALSGAIITAAALIGLGLAASGLGTRYAQFYEQQLVKNEETGDYRYVPDWEKTQVKFKDLDNPMKACLVMLIGTGLLGLLTTFLGLAYHHHRRHHEHLH